jgi:hypothetical protein
MNIKLSPNHFKELIIKGLSLDHIFLLRLINEQADLSALLKESAKISALHNSLIRKGLVTENDDKITTTGVELLVFMDSKAPGKLMRRKVDDSAFSIWWKEFPGTNNFTHNRKTFTGDRGLRTNESECRLKFDKILLEGEYTAQEIIDATKYDIFQKKEMSVKTGVNKLTYLHNSLTYLNQRDYEPFIELIKQGHKIINSEPEYDGVNI